MAFICQRGKRGNRPGRPQNRRQGHQNPESRETRNTPCHPRSQRPSPRGSATPARPTQERSSRSPSAWCPVRFGSAKQRKAEAKVAKSLSAKMRSARRRNPCDLRAKKKRLPTPSWIPGSRPGSRVPCPSTAHMHSPRGLRLDLVIRRRGRPDRYVNLCLTRRPTNSVKNIHRLRDHPCRQHGGSAPGALQPSTS